MERVGARPLGRPFGWLWAAYAVSTFGTWLAFDALPLTAVLVLHSAAAQVSLLAAAGPAVGAVAAVPLGPWVEFRRKRPVMIGADLLRCAALLSVPIAYACGRLGFAQLLLVSVVVSGAQIAFRSANGAFLKTLVPPGSLLAAGSRLESTTWTATLVGPPLGGALVGLFGPVPTVLADAVSYLLSALGIRAVGGREAPPPARPARPDGSRSRGGELLDGWRYILDHAALRPLFLNTVLVGGLILAPAPLLVVLMLGDLGFSPWQYGLAFGAPCVGGLVGARLSRPLVGRYGRRRVLLTAGTLRACFSLGLAFVGPGTSGLLLVVAVELALITCMGVFNPVFAAYRLEQTDTARVARTLTAWTVTSRAALAALTALWGVLAGLTGPRTAIAAAGLLLAATPVLLPWRSLDTASRPAPAPETAAPRG
ncbi:MFS transporter [Streptomyces sp. MS06]|uniref:MFS transporter n=1 Tax=Streptomyces sp. MS06 TaxID=3385974 RepID=UPI0039A0F295